MGRFTFYFGLITTDPFAEAKFPLKTRFRFYLRYEAINGRLRSVVAKKFISGGIIDTLNCYHPYDILISQSQAENLVNQHGDQIPVRAI